MARPQSFAVVGRERFVLAASAGMLIGGAISGAIEQNQNFNDCMLAAGWRLHEGTAVPTSGPVGARLALSNETPLAMPEQAPAPITMLAVQTPPAGVRRPFGVEVRPSSLPYAIPGYPRGTQALVVMDVQPGGAGAAAGLQRGDIILAFDRYQVPTMEGIQSALGSIHGGHTVAVAVWRDQKTQLASITF